MVERVEDMLLPNAVVQRIIKEALPTGINVGKEARETISRAATIFVLYLTSTARHQLHLRNQKKTLTPADVSHALQIMEMENFVEPLQKAMEQHKRQQKNKKDRKQQDQPPTNPSEAIQETGPIIDTEEQIAEDPVVDQNNVETMMSEDPVADEDNLDTETMTE